MSYNMLSMSHDMLEHVIHGALVRGLTRYLVTFTQVSTQAPR